MLKIYFAGPMFVPYERTYIAECAARLRAEGFEVFVPHEQMNKRPAEENQRFMAMDEISKAVYVYDTDFAGLQWANVVVALLDGTQVDDGTATEIGIFAEMIRSNPGDKKVIFGFATDMRVFSDEFKGEGKGLNYFTVGTIYKYGTVCKSFDEVVARLKGL